MNEFRELNSVEMDNVSGGLAFATILQILLSRGRPLV